MNALKFLREKGFNPDKKWHKISIEDLFTLLLDFSSQEIWEQLDLNPKEAEDLIKLVKNVRKLQADYKKTGCSTCKNALDTLEPLLDRALKEFFQT